MPATGPFLTVVEPGDGGPGDGDGGPGRDDDKDGELKGDQLPFTGAAGLPLLLSLGLALVGTGTLLALRHRRRA